MGGVELSVVIYDNDGEEVCCKAGNSATRTVGRVRRSLTISLHYDATETRRCCPKIILYVWR